MTTRELINLLERIESHHGGELPVELNYAHAYRMVFQDPPDKATADFIKNKITGPTVEFYINLP